MDSIYLNPKNADVLRNVVHERHPDDPAPNFYCSPLMSVPVIFGEHIPERNLHEQWRPPKGDRFCDYGPEDEAWMRPLGLGTIKTIDMGPLILAMQKRLDSQISEMLFSSTEVPTFRGYSTADTPSFKRMLTGGWA